MTSKERVHPRCVNASNPFHECTVACHERIVKGPARNNRKKSDNGNGSMSDFRKSADILRKGNPNCPKSSNPYHECNQYCPNGVVKTIPRVNGTIPTDSGKRNATESQLRKSGFSTNGSSNNPSPRSPLSAKKAIDESNSNSSSSSQPHHHNSSVKDHESTPEIEQVDKVAAYAFGALSRQNNTQSNPSSPTITSLHAPAALESTQADDSDVGDSISVVSDSYVAVGRYHVRPHLSSTLQSILEKYGDIAANSTLESASLRSYHLECICSVVQELQSTSVHELTKGKAKEALAVLKDAESSKIDVAWLRKAMNEHKDVIDISNEYQTAEAGKAECDGEIESTNNEIRLLEEELSMREQAMTAIKAKIEETEARLQDLELESSKRKDVLASARKKLETIPHKPLLEGFL